MPFSTAKYGYGYRKARAACLARNKHENGGLCVYCNAREATVADHQPPLYLFADPRQWNGSLYASCAKCSQRQGGRILNSGAYRRRSPERASRVWL